MPAPLGRTPTKRMPIIEVFGVGDSPATRAAVRFFRERRIVVRYVDLRKRRFTRPELRWFLDRLGAAALLEVGSPVHEGVGGIAAVPDGSDLVTRLLADVRLLRLPLVRFRESATAGRDEPTWRTWLAGPS